MQQDKDQQNDEQASEYNMEQTRATFGRMPGDTSHEEEMAKELTADDFEDDSVSDEHQHNNTSNATGVVMGWIALGLSVISFFVLPIIFGGAGIILGFASRARDAEILGNSAIIVSALSVIITLFIAPFV